MPYTTEHAARQADPSKFPKVRRENDKFGPGVDVIWGITPEGKTEVQSIRFDAKKFTPDEAKKWLADNKYSSSDFEPATGEVKMAELKGVEILDEGTWSGNTDVKIGAQDMDEMVANFKGGVVEPYLNLDHDDRFTEDAKKMLRVVSLGWVTNLYREGKKLLADFKQVPIKLAEMIGNGMLKKRSVEFYPKDKPYVTNGKAYGNVLKAVSFFGNSLPAVNTLSDDFEVLMELNKKSANEQIATVIFQNKGEPNMETVQVPKSEYDTLVKIKAQYEQMAGAQSQEELAKKAEADKAAQAALAENAALKKQNDELVKFKKDAEAAALAATQSEAEAFVKNVIEEGKLLAKFKDMKVKEYVSYSGDKDALVLFKEDLKNRAPIVNLKQLVKDPPAQGEHSGETVNFKNTDDAEAAVQKLMKDEGLSWLDAAVKLKLVEKDA